MNKNQAGQIIYFQMLIASSQLAFTGTPTGTFAGDNGSDAACTGTFTAVGSTGKFSYAPTQAETNFDVVAFSFVGTLATPITRSFDTVNSTLLGAYPALGIIDSGTAQAATSTTLQLRSAAAFADGTLVGAVLTAFGTTQGYWQSRVINSNVSSTDTATVDAWNVTPSGTVTYVLFASPPASASLLPNVNTSTISANAVNASALATDAVTEIQAGLGTTANQSTIISGIAAVQADTDNIQTRLPTSLVSGRIDASVGAMATDVITSGALAASAVTEIQTGLPTATAVAAIQTDTDDIQSRLPAALVGGRMDSSTGAMAANTLTASALATDAVTEIVTAMLTTVMTESYAADGAAMTMAQALFLMQQSIGDFSISGTSLLVKKLDGATTAATYTLNDATNPTSRTRTS